MLIKLLPTQIEPYWELIKYAGIQADGVKEGAIPEYCIDLLLGLLNGRIECILSVDKESRVQRILLISFYFDIVNQKKQMIFRAAFAFVRCPADVWDEEARIIFQYAKKRGCEMAFFTTSNKMIEKLAERYGMQECSKSYSIHL